MFKTFAKLGENSEKKFRLLKRKCFNKKNDGLLGLIETSDKLDAKRKKFLKDINGILDRTHLDRPFVLKEKMKCIWNESSAKIIKDYLGNRPYNSNSSVEEASPKSRESTKSKRPPTSMKPLVGKNVRDILIERSQIRLRENK